MKISNTIRRLRSFALLVCATFAVTQCNLKDDNNSTQKTTPVDQVDKNGDPIGRTDANVDRNLFGSWVSPEPSEEQSIMKFADGSMSISNSCRSDSSPDLEPVWVEVTVPANIHADSIEILKEKENETIFDDGSKMCQASLPKAQFKYQLNGNVLVITPEPAAGEPSQTFTYNKL